MLEFLGRSPVRRLSHYKFKASLLGSLALFTGIGAQAQELLPEVSVEGGSTAPLQQAPQVGKTQTKIEDLPASVSVVPAATVSEQGGTDIKAAIRNVSGLSEGGGSSFNFYDRFLIRGLDPRIYQDGFPDGDQINGFPHSLNGVDHIEVLKGPGSALLGSGPPGGSINIVHAAPSATPSYGVSAQAGSFGTVNTSAYATGPTTVQGLNYRVDGMAAHTDGFRGVKSADYELRPTLSLTTLDHVTTASLDIRHIESTPDTQGIVYVRPAPGAIAMPLSTVPSETKYSSPYAHANQDFLRAAITDEWTVNDVLTVNNRLSYSRRDLDILRNGDGGTVTGTVLSNRTLRHQHDVDNDVTYQLEPVWKFRTGDIAHTLLTGIEAREQWMTVSRETASLPNIDNIFAPVIPDQSTAGLNFVQNFDDHLNATYVGIYATDQIDINDKLKVRLGVRQDFWNTSLTPQVSIPGRVSGTTPLLGGVTYSRNDRPFSWNAGALYHILPGISPYIGVSVGHLANFNSEATQNGVQAPESSVQYEAGIKFEGLQNKVTFTTAVFDTERHNVQSSLVIGPDTFVVFNSQRTKGFEADLEVRPTDKWKIFANATIQNTELTDNPSQPTAIGKEAPGVPRQIFNFWTTYDFNIGNVDGFRVGGGLRARARIYADALNTNAVPSWIVGDVFIGYYQPKWDIALGIKNVTNATYYVTANGAGGFVGDARTYYVKSSYHF